MGYVEIIKQLDVFTCITLAIFVFATIIQLAYYIFVYLRFSLHKEKHFSNQENETPPVSVIICARNEEENLRMNLPAVLEQDYPSFEVIVVNDCSEDDTEQVLAEFKQKYPHLRSTIIKKDGSFLNSKKFAATVGIRAAQHEWMLFTDADCHPDSQQWIASMSRHFVEQKGIVLGYGGYMPQKNYLNKWIRYDTCFTALRYFGFARIGKTYMGMGRNLAYRKSLFYAHNGFAEHAHIPSGDSGLFVNRAATAQNAAVSCIPDAHTRSIAIKTFAEWIRQKRSHIITGKYYRKSQIFWLSLEPISRVLMWTAFVVLMIICPFWEYILIAFIVRMIIFMATIRMATQKLNEPGILQHAIIFDLTVPFVYLFVYLLNRLSSKHYQWK
jgi:glycosyltransferase involved in cell wall biosynthesis